MQRIEINVITGEKKVVDLSAAEIAALPTPVPPTYQELRAAAYPPITDYLDGVVKGDAVQVQSYVDACLAVKAEYPK
jgi:hypothetical protein